MNGVSVFVRTRGNKNTTRVRVKQTQAKRDSKISFPDITPNLPLGHRLHSTFACQTYVEMAQDSPRGLLPCFGSCASVRNFGVRLPISDGDLENGNMEMSYDDK